MWSPRAARRMTASLEALPRTIKTVQLIEERQEYMRAASNYIKAQFLKYGGGSEHNGKRNENERQFYVHVTVATDKGNVTSIFNNVQQIVVSEGLRKNNLL